MNTLPLLKIGLVSISDRASTGIYADQGLPELKKWLQRAVLNPLELVEQLIPDEQALIESTLIRLADDELCPLILTTGGTGPYLRDVTPEATLAVADRVIPGFGELMRQISLHFTPTAILSRQVGVLRGNSLILNLPGKPSAIAETLGGVKDEQGKTMIPGIFASIPIAVDAVGGPLIQTDADFCPVVLPKR
ncbi:molybdopterin adenylyltransferase [Snodgrassella communis]|jgi:molybdopterin adenylyltransferase|uniref:Molybdopterin adenylyltransferase n=1 Tax=Snodgrassella communis TaxID=2946699 RepID=A0A836Z2I7_9NEIS|nr:molybdopterin adenylyltransferase [Snodgrassella communis]KDN14213.1 Molybdopterin biosynthesis Mog protein, molybdochelatase [Snodgrassella communis]PIT06600.1 molybdopterin adenylyltransferase [Snodgrassella communis]PIT11125.1 molybdopterin adenylyltransferase [Snodgrassella communis]PIT19552.1 molybdopterin adenylyltransferase [Snodgrassella communis]PIT23047.1 molybdopterin adenylyltransferase [Snodgrassella communis]